MKTLIFNGSPRKNGDTASLLNILTSELTGEYMTVSCYYDDISPCIDCRVCMKERRCSLQDHMQDIYPYLEECDNIVIASPIYFSELTGRMLDTLSRLQIYYCARFFRNEDTGIKPKRGGVILVGGGDGEPTRAYATARTLLHHMNVSDADMFPLICSHSTNTVPAADNGEAVSGVHRLAAFLGDRKEERL